MHDIGEIRIQEKKKNYAKSENFPYNDCVFTSSTIFIPLKCHSNKHFHAEFPVNLLLADTTFKFRRTDAKKILRCDKCP